MDQQKHFRKEALAYRARSRYEGALLGLSAGWTRWSFWVLAGGAIAAACYCTLSYVSIYATGPAIVSAKDRTQIFSAVTGTIKDVAVQPGQGVNENDVLVRVLLEDGAHESVLHLIRSPRSGIVGQLHARPGQRISTGDFILDIFAESSSWSIVALVPGRYRPMLHTGTTMRYELLGYPYEFHECNIDFIGSEIIPASDASLFVHAGNNNIGEVTEPFTIVRGTISTPLFGSDGQQYHYFDGMSARAQIRVRSERLIVALVPGAKALFRHGH